MSAKTESAAAEADLLETAVEYFSKAFPNPTRQGCPHLNRLRELASSSDPISGDVRAHLFQCSECFREFRDARLAVVSSTQRGSPGAIRSTWRPTAMVAAVAVTVLAIGLGRVSWSDFGFDRGARQQEAAGADPRSSASPTGSEAPTRFESHGSARGSAPTLRIELRPASVRRGTTESIESTSPPISIQPGPNRLEIELPDDYPVGAYRIAIVDAFDEVLIEVTALAVKQSLVAQLDASHLDSGRRFLRIQHVEQPPDYVPIIVSRR